MIKSKQTQPGPGLTRRAFIALSATAAAAASLIPLRGRRPANNVSRHEADYYEPVPGT
jgi:hypothetical protein